MCQTIDMAIRPIGVSSVTRYLRAMTTVSNYQHCAEAASDATLLRDVKVAFGVRASLKRIMAYLNPLRLILAYSLLNLRHQRMNR